MDNSRTNRRILSWISFGFLGLAVCVFVWGLAYKLSLYDPPQAISHTMPQAKLLSKEEQPVPVETSAILTGLPLLSVAVTSTAIGMNVLLLACLLLNLNRFVEYVFGNRVSWRRRHAAGLSYFFVLPPPVLA